MSVKRHTTRRERNQIANASHTQTSVPSASSLEAIPLGYHRNLQTVRRIMSAEKAGECSKNQCQNQDIQSDPKAFPSSLGYTVNPNEGQAMRDRLGVGKNPKADIAESMTQVMREVSAEDVYDDGLTEAQRQEILDFAEELDTQTSPHLDDDGSTFKETSKSIPAKVTTVSKKTKSKTGITYADIIEKLKKSPGRALEALTLLSENMSRLKEEEPGSEDNLDIWEEHLGTLMTMSPYSLSILMGRLTVIGELDPPVLKAFLEGACSSFQGQLGDQAKEMYRNITKLSEYSLAQLKIMKADTEAKKKEISALLVSLREASGISADFKANVERVALMIAKLDVTPPISTARSLKSRDYQEKDGQSSSLESAYKVVDKIGSNGWYRCSDGLVRMKDGVAVALKDSTRMLKQVYRFVSTQSAGVNSAVWNRDLQKLFSRVSSNPALWAQLNDPNVTKEIKKDIFTKLMITIPPKEDQWQTSSDNLHPEQA